MSIEIVVLLQNTVLKQIFENIAKHQVTTKLFFLHNLAQIDTQNKIAIIEYPVYYWVDSPYVLLLPSPSTIQSAIELATNFKKNMLSFILINSN